MSTETTDFHRQWAGNDGCYKRRLYFDCAALHFLCCLPVLEHLNVFEFYSQYEVINRTRKNEEDLMEMINIVEFGAYHLEFSSSIRQLVGLGGLFCQLNVTEQESLDTTI